MGLAFRPLAASDLRRMHRWLNDPAVVRWWEGADVSWPAIVAGYGPAHADPVEHWLALDDGAPVGWLQCYTAADRVEEETDLWREHLPLDTTGGIDYLVGEPSARGKGLGARMIRAFAEAVAFPRHPAWTHVAAGPFEANGASWRALAAAGFTRVATLDDEAGPCVLMALARADLAA